MPGGKCQHKDSEGVRKGQAPTQNAHQPSSAGSHSLKTEAENIGVGKGSKSGLLEEVGRMEVRLEAWGTYEGPHTALGTGAIA